MRAVEASAVRLDGFISLAYRIRGAIAEVALPPRGALPLWQHTCCEAFVARRGGTAYDEFNFSPSGDWAAYAFTAYRQGEACPVSDPCIAVRAGAELLELEARVSVPSEPLLVGLTAVIEERSGTRSYWALRHGAGRPDFHERSTFALELA